MSVCFALVSGASLQMRGKAYLKDQGIATEQRRMCVMSPGAPIAWAAPQGAQIEYAASEFHPCCQRSAQFPLQVPGCLESWMS